MGFGFNNSDENIYTEYYQIFVKETDEIECKFTKIHAYKEKKLHLCTCIFLTKLALYQIR